MSKAQTLATTVSTGNVLADGTVAYAEVSGTPTLAAVATSGAYADVSGTPTLATVATTGAYADVSGTPTLPTFPSGAVVGTTDTQTLTNKTISGAGNTLSNISLTSSVTGTLPTSNGGTGNINGTVSKLETTSFSIEESGGKLVFKYGATTIGSLDSSGNFSALANVTAYTTP
jgi:hypothetical protein